MAIDEKESKELAKAQKDLNKKFTELTTRMGEVNGTLAKEAANLRKSSRDTFQGMLNARKLAKVSEAIANDMQLQQLGKHIDNLNEDNKELQKAHDDIIKEREDSLKTDESLNTKREQLEALQTNLDTDIYTSKKAEKAAQKRANELQAQITKETTDIQSIYAKDIETAALELKQSEEVLKEQRKLQEERMEMYSDQLKDASKDGNFSKFSDGLKELSGGTIDLGDSFDNVVKKFNAIKNVVESLGNFGKALNGLKDGIGSVAKDAMSMGKGLFGKKNKDGSKDMRFKDNKESVDAMQRMSQRMTAATTAFTDGMKLVGTKLLSGAKKFIPAIGALIASTVMFVGGLLLTAVGLLPLALPLIAVAVAVGLVIGLVVAGFKYLYNEVEWFRNSVDFLIEGVKSIATFVMDFVGTLNFSAITDMFGEMWEAIKGVFSGLITFFKGAFAGDFEMMFQGIKDIFNSVLDYIKAPFKAVAKFFGGGDKPQDMIDAEASGLVIDKMGREDGLDKKKLKDAPNGQLKAILAEGDMSKENLALVQEELNARDLKPAAESQSGQEVGTSTQEVKQGEKQGNIVNVVNQSSSPTSVNNTQVHNASGSPRDTDRTALSLNAIAV
jgi:hypothetical protein